MVPPRHALALRCRYWGLGPDVTLGRRAGVGRRGIEPKLEPVGCPPPHFAPRAKRVISLFCAGAVSHVDTYDYKPELEKRASTPFDLSGKLEFFASKPGNCVPSYWPFRQHGQSGRWMSDLFPRLATCVDDMAFIYSMRSKSAVHAPAMFLMNSGFVQPGFPAMGAWVAYGLGSETQELPAFVVLPDTRGVPPGGPANWRRWFSAGGLSGHYNAQRARAATDR